MKKLLIFIFLFFLIVNKFFAQEYPEKLNKRKLACAITTESLLYSTELIYLRFVWYKDHERVPFHFYNDNKGYLQIDKFGHAFGAYFESYIGYHWLRSAGVSRNKSLLYGGTLGFLLQAPIEIFDGIYEGWGFSWGDMLANTSGAALLIGQEALFNDQIIKYKFSMSPSEYVSKPVPPSST